MMNSGFGVGDTRFSVKKTERDGEGDGEGD